MSLIFENDIEILILLDVPLIIIVHEPFEILMNIN